MTSCVTYLCGWFFEVEPEEGDVVTLQLLHWEGKGEETVGVEGDAHFVTVRTDESGFELAVEHVHDDAVVPLQMVLPGLLRHNLHAKDKYQIQNFELKINSHLNYFI